MALNITLDALVNGTAALIGAVIGGLMTAYGAHRATQEAIKHQTAREEMSERQRKRAFLLALEAEITTIWNSYESEMVLTLQNHPDGHPFLVTLPVVGDYLVVYRENTSVLGLIEDDELRKAIVSTYSLATNLIDAYRYNNQMIARRNMLIAQLGPHLEAAQNNHLDADQATISAMFGSLLQEMAGYAKTLKTAHEETAVAVLDLKRRISLYMKARSADDVTDRRTP